MIIKSYQANTNHINILEKDKSVDSDKKSRPLGKEEDKSSIYAGNLNLLQDKAALKNIQAQRNALKLVLDTFKTDLSTDDSVRLLEKNVKLREDEISLNHKERDHILKLRDGLLELHNVSDESEEYKDLQILRKHRDMITKGGPGLTADEKDRLASIDMDNLTEYQKQSLEYDKMADEFSKRSDAALNSRNVIKTAIADIKIEMLKRDPMVESSKKAEEVVMNAAKEAVDLYMNEVKENVDSQMEETREKIEENKEKEKEIKEKEAAKEKEEAYSDYDSLQKKIDELGIIKKMLDEDIKGIEVDVLL